MLAHPSNLLIKDFLSGWIMYGTLSDYRYWVNSNISSFSDAITISQKSLFFHTFLWYLNFFSVLKEWIQLKQKKSLLCFEVIHCNKADNFFLQDNSFLLFFFIRNHNLFFKIRINFWNISWTYFFLSNR